MAIRLESFSGKVTLLGKDCEVSFAPVDNGARSVGPAGNMLGIATAHGIAPLTKDEAIAIIAALEKLPAIEPKTAASVKAAPAAAKPPIATVTRPVASAPPAKGEPGAGVRPALAAARKANEAANKAALSAPATRTAPTPESAPAVPRKRVAVPPPEEDEEREAIVVESESTDAAVDQDGVVISEEIMGATMLRGVLTCLIQEAADNGEERPSAEQLTEWCVAHKELVPVLSRINGEVLGERVARTLQVMPES